MLKDLVKNIGKAALLIIGMFLVMFGFVQIIILLHTNPPVMLAAMFIYIIVVMGITFTMEDWL